MDFFADFDTLSVGLPGHILIQLFNIEPSLDTIVDMAIPVIDRFLATHSYDVTVIVPTSNPLNEYIVRLITSKNPDIEYIRGALLKLSTDDIANLVEDKDSAFVQTYKDDIMSARRLLFTYLERMDRERGGTFTKSAGRKMPSL